MRQAMESVSRRLSAEESRMEQGRVGGRTGMQYDGICEREIFSIGTDQLPSRYVILFRNYCSHFV